MPKQLIYLGALITVVSLATCILTPILVFAGAIEFDAYMTLFNLATIGWFVGVSLWLMPLMARKKPETS